MLRLPQLRRRFPCRRRCGNHRQEPDDQEHRAHRLSGVHAGVLRMRYPSRRVDDPPRVREPGRECPDRAGGVHALRAAHLRGGLSGRCDQAHRRRRGAVRAQAAVHRVRELRGRVSVRRARALRRPQDHDEVRHVLRPDERRQEADVRDRVSQPGALLRHSGADRTAAPAVRANQHVPVRSADHHHPGAHDGAAQAGDGGATHRCHRVDGGAATKPGGVVEDGERARRADSAAQVESDPFAEVEV